MSDIVKSFEGEGSRTDDETKDVEKGVSFNHQNDLEETNKGQPGAKRSMFSSSFSARDTHGKAFGLILKQALAGAGSSAFGIVAIEIWVYNAEKAVLERCKGGWWRDPVFETSDSLERLEDEMRPDYLAPKDLPSGVGVAGTMWSEVYGTQNIAKWRDLLQMSQDPDQPYNERLNVLAEVFGLAAAVNFRSKDAGETVKGTVVFYARRSVNLEKISTIANRDYLRSTAYLLGGTVSWEKLRKDAVLERKSEMDAALKRVKAKVKIYGNIANMKSKPQSQSQPLAQTEEKEKIKSPLQETLTLLMKKILKTLSKFKGAGQILPPAISNEVCLFIFFGSLLSLLIVSGVNQAIKARSSGDWAIIMGPFGALANCHYGFTGAPATQPRNSICGLIISASIGILSTYIPADVIPIWVRIAFAAAIAISLTMRFGFGHPPAAGIAVLFASRVSNSWEDLIFLVVGYIFSIGFAIIYIDFFDAKTYPMYWSFPNPLAWIKSRNENEKLE